MLYLNTASGDIIGVIANLTLTNVVFESVSSTRKPRTAIYLTLTNVVFEYAFSTTSKALGCIFNFNKCCI